MKLMKMIFVSFLFFLCFTCLAIELNKDDDFNNDADDDEDEARRSELVANGGELNRPINEEFSSQYKKQFQPGKEWKVVQDGFMNTKSDNFTLNEIRRALKKLKTSKSRTSVGDESDGAEQTSPPLPHMSPFRSIEEIKRDFHQLNIKLQTDGEILMTLIEKYKKLIDLQMKRHDENADKFDKKEKGYFGGGVPGFHIEDVKLHLLTDLEYYLHQVDNANLFVDAGGMDLLKFDVEKQQANLNITMMALLTLSSATQSNPHAQVEAVKSGLFKVLVDLLNSTTSSLLSSSTSSFSSLNMMKRIISSLSCIMRNFPHSQLKFHQLGGQNVLIKVVEGFLQVLQSHNHLLGNEKSENDTTVQDDVVLFKKHKQIVIQIISLMNDLMEEKILASTDDHTDKRVKEMKLKQYEKLHHEAWLSESGWCGVVSTLARNDHAVVSFDEIDVVTRNMKQMNAKCAQYYRHLVKYIDRWIKIVSSSRDGDEDDYIDNLLKNLHFIKKFYSDEL
ncbi:hypothetical protein HELRODRAFT_194324 [Helobdella robusta]|uniref:Nucleotide exchange factor SIL1 n=1 Tax=Helobdella robusta TaxID=6412 RepID=T1FVX7_HELRO|nr:hypothetical protein HELRODRAFT_194324 [Helobdella robusta]ESN92171.1 hypothetical protein HELRODRAFT_194324 [Helobdella robusta]